MKSLLVLLVLKFSMMNSSFAGDRIGNGGGTHYCSQLGTAEMYDLYEAKTRYQMVWDENFDFYTTAAEMDQYLRRKLNQTNPYLSDQVWKILTGLDDRMVYLKNIDLKEIEDANFLMTNKDCEYAQLANWDGTLGKIFVDKELYLKLPLVHKVAFRWHEAIYKFFRDHSFAKNSDYTRKVVGLLFSDIKMPKVYEWDFEKTENINFALTGPNVRELQLNIPRLTYNKTISMTLLTFSRNDQSRLEKLEYDVLRAKRKERRAMKVEIEKLKRMKVRPACLTIVGDKSVKICKGETIELKVLDSSSFGVQEQDTNENLPLYLNLEDATAHDSVLMTLNPVGFTDEWETTYSYTASVRFTFGYWLEQIGE